MDLGDLAEAIRRAAQIGSALTEMKRNVRKAHGSPSGIGTIAEPPLRQLEADLDAHCNEARMSQAHEQRKAAALAAMLLSNPEVSVADCVRISGMLRQCTLVFVPHGQMLLPGTGEALSLPLFFVEARMRSVAVEADAALAAAAGSNARLFGAAAALMAGPVLRVVSEFRACFIDEGSTLGAGTSRAAVDAKHGRLVARRHAEQVLADYLFGRIEWFLRAIETLAAAAQSTSALAEYWTSLVALDEACGRAQASFFPLAQDVIMRRARHLISASCEATLASVVARLHGLRQSAGSSGALGGASSQACRPDHVSVAPAACLSEDISIIGQLDALAVAPANQSKPAHAITLPTGMQEASNTPRGEQGRLNSATDSVQDRDGTGQIDGEATSAGDARLTKVSEALPISNDAGPATLGTVGSIIESPGAASSRHDPFVTGAPNTTQVSGNLASHERTPKSAKECKSFAPLSSVVSNDAREIDAPADIRSIPLLVLVHNGVLAHDFFEQLRGMALFELRSDALRAAHALVDGLRSALAAHPLATPQILGAYDRSIAPLYVHTAESYYSLRGSQEQPELS